MKKKFLSIVGVAAFAVAMAFNINAGMNNDTVSDMMLANVEALASGEGGGGEITCYSTYRITGGGDTWVIQACNDCTQVTCYEYRDSSKCKKGVGILI